MPVGAATQQIGPIDVNQLIGTADKSIVEPRNVAMLTDAFRQGVITADDIVNRLGELGKSKQKAEIQQAQEFTSPKAQALRAQQTAAGTEQAQLAEAQALRAQVLQEFPAVAYFDKLGPAAGIQAPKLPDGTPDYKQMEVIGAKLALYQAQRGEAQAKLNNIDDVVHNNTIFAKTKQGEIVDRTYVEGLRKEATQTFESWGQMQPGATQGVAPAAPVIEARNAPATAPAVIEPAMPAPAGTRVGPGTSLGTPPAPPPRQKAIDPTKLAQDLAQSQNIIQSIGNAKQLVNIPGVVGPLAGSAPVELGNRLAATFGIQSDKFENQRELEILISQKILEGAQLMKGNLSDKDVRFLKESTPKLSDPPALWNKFLDLWQGMTQQNVNILSGSEGLPKSAKATTPTTAALGQAAATATPATQPELPRLSPEEARKLPPGTPFLTLDNRPKIR